MPRIEAFVLFVAGHWLALVNLALFVFVALPAVSPALLSSESPVLQYLGGAIFTAYHATCHQLPERSYFVFGHQMAWCQRDVAIWGTLLLSGLAFSVVRRRIRPLVIRWYLLFCLPMAVDGVTQLFGYRESTWELRTITGFLFAVGSAWLVFPILERGMREVREGLEASRAAAIRTPGA